MNEAPMIPLEFERLTPGEMRARAWAFYDTLRRRRSVRHFSREPIDLEVVRRCVAAAATAPSGANKQPWTFVLVTDPEVKRRVREAAEREEREFYSSRAPKRWLDDLRPFNTNEHKPFIEDAPCLIAVFARRHGEDGSSRNYYVQESVGIAVGMLLAALHHAGLATLTHTPSPMGFLSEILARPSSERAFLLIPVGLPAEGCEVPAIERLPLGEVLIEV